MTDGGPGGPRHHHHWWRIAGIVTAVVVVVGGAAGYDAWDRYLRNDSKPVNVGRVERRFSTGDSGGATRTGSPPPGVYLYATTGSESVSALGGATNTYPPTTTLTVTNTACGIDTRWDVLVGRYDIARRCRRPDGAWVLVGTVSSDRFFNQTQADPYTCDDVLELPAQAKPGATATGTCTDPPNSTQLRYTIIGPESVTVAGKPVQTIHLGIAATQGGQRGGGGVEDRWVQPGTNLVVRSRGSERDTSPSPIGSVVYQQQYDITLQSLRPRQ